MGEQKPFHSCSAIMVTAFSCFACWRFLPPSPAPCSFAAFGRAFSSCPEVREELGSKSREDETSTHLANAQCLPDLHLTPHPARHASTRSITQSPTRCHTHSRRLPPRPETRLKLSARRNRRQVGGVGHHTRKNRERCRAWGRTAWGRREQGMLHCH